MSALINSLKQIICPNCKVMYFAKPEMRYVQCQRCYRYYHQKSRTIDTPEWIGDFIERCKGEK